MIGLLKGLWKEPSSALSLLWICFVVLMAVGAYCWAPVRSENANEMIPQWSLKPPGFRGEILRSPTEDFTSVNWFSGENIPTQIIPVEQAAYQEGQWRYLPYGRPIDAEQWEYTSAPLELEERTFYLGTDRYGRDLLSRLIIGARVSVSVGAVAVLISLLVGIPLGAIAGFYGGKVDTAIRWFLQVVWSIPTLLLVIAFTLALGKGFWQVFVAIGLTMWVEVARVVRGEVWSQKNREYVDAARVAGFSSWYILRKHVLPNSLAPLIVVSAANFAAAILVESGLSFLGLGAQPPIPSWGGIIKDHYAFILMGKAWLSIAPGLLIMSLVLSFMIIGNRLRDLLDVRNIQS